MSEWWVGRRGADPVGPVSTETLVRGVKEKKVPPNALVCRVGEQQWHHVAQVDELWDRINPEEARTAVTEKPWFGAVPDSSPPAESLADAEDGDDAATRIYDTRMMAHRSGATVGEKAAHTEATDSPTVPLVTASTSGSPATTGSAPVSSAAVSSEAARAPHTAVSKPSPVKAAAPAFRPPASLTAARAAKAEAPATATASSAAIQKEPARAPKSVIPPPRFGVDRVAPASPIAAGAFISKPPSVRPQPMPSTEATPEAASQPSPSRVKDSSPPPAGQSSPPPAGQSSPPPARRSSSPPPRESAAAAARQTMAIAARKPVITAARQNGTPAARQNTAPSAAVESTVPAARQNASQSAPQSARQSAPNGARLASTDKSRQPIPPVPAAVIPLPPDSELASLVRDNVDVSLTETRPDRPDRRVTKDSDVSQRRPLARPATSPSRDSAAQKAVAVPRVEPKQIAPRPVAAAKPAPEAMPRIEAKPIVTVSDPDDEDATVIRDVRKDPLPQVQRAQDEDEDATVVRQQIPSSPPPADEDETVVLRQHAPPMVGNAPPAIEHPRPQPVVAASHELQMAQDVAAPSPREAEEHRAHPAEAHSGERPVSSQSENREPVEARTAPIAIPHTAAVVAQRAAPEPAPHDLFDEDDEPLPDRARDYAGAHGPPSSSDSARPRPAAGTPAPPSVIVSQHHVPMDSLGRVIQPHTELTRPAMRTIRPPGTIQISIATLIVGAMTLVVIVLSAVLVLR